LNYYEGDEPEEEIAVCFRELKIADQAEHITLLWRRLWLKAFGSI
jgi:hypothetical protein